MRNLKLLLAAFAMLAVPVAASPAAAQSQEIAMPEGDWSPDGIDATFPAKIGDYERVSINTYGGGNYSLGYNMWGADDHAVHSITVYLFAPRGTCDGEMEASMSAVERLNAGAEKLAVDTAPSPTGKRGAALHARYRLPNGFGAMKQAAISDVYLYCPANSRFWIKARSTWAADRSDLESGTAMVLRAITWPTETR